MPEQKQIIVEVPPAPNKPMGARKDVNLTSCFPTSPVYTGELNDIQRKKEYTKLALDGDVAVNGGPLAGPGNGLNSFNRDFPDAPNLEDVDIASLNIPSPYMPNPTSPGPGSINANDKPAYTGEVMDPALNVEFGTGLGGLTSPSKTAKEISKQNTLGTYISGKSYLGSDGVN